MLNSAFVKIPVILRTCFEKFSYGGRVNQLMMKAVGENVIYFSKIFSDIDLLQE